MLPTTTALLLTVLSLFALAVYAAPEPLEHRQINSVFSSITSAVVSVATGPVPSVFTQATSAAGAAASDVTSVVGSVYTAATSAAGSAASHAATHLNAAPGGPSSFGLTASQGLGLVTLVAGAVLGAVITL